MITVESEHVHEVVRVVRVRHIVTHVSSIGQFFHRRSSIGAGSQRPAVLARANRPGARRPRRAAARVVTPRPRAARLYNAQKTPSRGGLPKGREGRPAPATSGGATTGVHVSFGFAENQPPPFDRIPI